MPIAGFTPPASLSRAAGYDATWTAGAGSRFRISVIANPNSTIEKYVLTCEVPDTGAYTVPPAAVALIPPATEGHVTVMRYSLGEAVDGTAMFVVGVLDGTIGTIPLTD